MYVDEDIGVVSDVPCGCTNPFTAAAIEERATRPTDIDCLCTML